MSSSVWVFGNTFRKTSRSGDLLLNEEEVILGETNGWVDDIGNKFDRPKLEPGRQTHRRCPDKTRIDEDAQSDKFKL